VHDTYLDTIDRRILAVGTPAASAGRTTILLTLKGLSCSQAQYTAVRNWRSPCRRGSPVGVAGQPGTRQVLRLIGQQSLAPLFELHHGAPSRLCSERQSVAELSVDEVACRVARQSSYFELEVEIVGRHRADPGGSSGCLEQDCSCCPQPLSKFEHMLEMAAPERPLLGN